MVKQILPALAFIILLSSCSTFKPLNFTSSQKIESGSPSATQSKFIEDISVTPQPNAVDKTQVKPETRQQNLIINNPAGTSRQQEEADELAKIFASRSREMKVEDVSSVQLKYTVLLNTEVESLPNKQLLESVDQWYGVRYRTGGNTKSGVDCSGFSVAVYAAAYGIMLPRVSRDQYRISRKISTTELQEGDLVFFDTKGGGQVSHVGIYLGNNKFIHASVSKGVMVNDLLQPYYRTRFIGGGRIDNKSIASTVSPTP